MGSGIVALPLLAGSAVEAAATNGAIDGAGGAVSGGLVNIRGFEVDGPGMLPPPLQPTTTAAKRTAADTAQPSGTAVMKGKRAGFLTPRSPVMRPRTSL